MTRTAFILAEAWLLASLWAGIFVVGAYLLSPEAQSHVSPLAILLWAAGAACKIGIATLPLILSAVVLVLMGWRRVRFGRGWFGSVWRRHSSDTYRWARHAAILVFTLPIGAFGEQVIDRVMSKVLF